MLEPIGRIRSPYRDKLAVPRQSGLAPSAIATLELDPARVPAVALRGLEQASHVWVIFLFHLVDAPAGPTVRPPRLGGKTRLGALATRSPFRPNPIGLSAVRLLGIDGHTLTVAGGDFVDETPVLDLKPYLPWTDAIADARCEWAGQPPAPLPVRMLDAAVEALARHPDGEVLESLICESLRFDPRPPAQIAADPDRTYAVQIMDVDVRWHVHEGELVITQVLAPRA